MEAIDKEKVIAEIKELYNDIDKCISDLIAARGNHDGNGISNAHWRMETLMVNTQQAICNVIDTFEVKEVDLEREVEEYIRKEFTSAEPHDEFLTTVMQLDDMVLFAKHFYELGINSKK